MRNQPSIDAIGVKSVIATGENPDSFADGEFRQADGTFSAVEVHSDGEFFRGQRFEGFLLFRCTAGELAGAAAEQASDGGENADCADHRAEKDGEDHRHVAVESPRHFAGDRSDLVAQSPRHLVHGEKNEKMMWAKCLILSLSQPVRCECGYKLFLVDRPRNGWTAWSWLSCLECFRCTWGIFYSSKLD